MKRIWRASWRWLGRILWKQFLMGIVIVVPIGATVLILVWIFNAIDGILEPVIKGIWGRPVAGVGFGITIVVIFLAGLITNNIIGKRLITYAESFLSRVPLVWQLYNGIKQILESFSRPSKAGYMEVVLIEFPRVGMKAIGFVTNETSDESGKKLFHIFVPTSPNPTSGFLQIVEEDKITHTKMSVDDALKVVVSAGRMSPGEHGYQFYKDS
jgi:uncharacterized membrane protein